MAISGIMEIKECMKKEVAQSQAQDSEKSPDSSNNTTNPTGFLDKNFHYVTHFIYHLALCNTVMCDNDKSNKKEMIYKASSPDELALVNGAKTAGI
jgi:magnesium-transporting ATPase (P-type)